MERFDKSGSGKQSGSRFSQHLNDPSNEVTASRACPDLHRNLRDVTSQLQMMSDSKAGYKQKSKYRPLRKAHDALANMKPRRKANNSIPESFPEENGNRGKVIVSYMFKNNHLSSRESLFNRRSGILSDSYHSIKSYRRFEGSTSESSNETSADGDPELKEVFDLIQAELKELRRLYPSMANLISSLSESVSHYEECTRCSSKLVSSLPWILTRIKDLVKFARNKRRKSNSKLHSWFNPKLKESPKKKRDSRKPDFKSITESYFNSGVESGTQTSAKQLREIGKLEKIDARHLVEEGCLGFQVILDVKPEKKKRKILFQTDRRSSLSQTYPAQLRDRSPVPVHHLLLTDSEAEFFIKKRRKVSTSKQISFAHSLEFAFASSEKYSFLTFVPVGGISQFQRSRSAFYLKPVHFLEKRVLLPSKNFITSCSQLTGNILNRGLIRWPPHTSTNANRKYDIQNFLTNAPEIVKELLREAQESKMDALKKLEEEVKGLKDLMLKVHMNQMDLSKILLEEGIYSEPLIKLTDPNLLGEEFQVLRKTSELENADGLDKHAEIETLTTEVLEIRKKCSLKLQMISTLVKGLKSNVPKVWWEESVGQAFDESQSIEDLDLDKVDEFIRQTQLFLIGTQKAPEPSPLVPRSEELPSEEEPKMKGIVGANVENLKNLSYFDHKMPKKTTDFDSILVGKSSTNILAFPATSAPKMVDPNIRRHENQISLLNMENERLWHEVQELRELWEVSLRQLEESRKAQSMPENHSFQETLKSPGKMINLTIQILTDKNSRRVENSSTTRAEKYNAAHPDVLNKLSNSLPTVKSSDSESDVYQESRESPDQELLAKFNAKLDRRKSNYDLNFIDDSFSASKNDKSDQSVQEFMPPTPHPSGHEIFQLIKPREWSVAETSDGHRAKPLRKPDIQYLLQKPSLMDLVDSHSSGMHATMANERELQPILENEHSDADPSACSSGSVTQAIQRLRSRVRSIHKEVTVLKSKNDRIDKLLDKLMNDAAETNKSFERMGNNLNDLNNRLGRIFSTEVESTAGVSDTDRESDYETGLEDFLDGDSGNKSEGEKSQAVSPYLSDLPRISAFIQNILHEDQLAGIAIVDLFVSVKSAKDNLDYLAMRNSEISEKMALLNDKSRIFKKEYKSLVLKMRELLEKMKEDSLNQNKLKMRRIGNPSLESNFGNPSQGAKVSVIKETKESAKPGNKKETEEPKKNEKSDSEKENEVPKKSVDTDSEKEPEVPKECVEPDNKKETEVPKEAQLPNTKAMCSKESRCIFNDEKEIKKLKKKCETTASSSQQSRQEDSDSTQKKKDCPCCLMSKIHQNPLHRPPIFQEAFLGSFLASLLLYLQKRPKESTSSQEEKLKSYGDVTLNDLTIHMLCDLCEIVKRTVCQESEMKDSCQLSLTEPEENKEDLHWSSSVSCASSARLSKPVVKSDKSRLKNEVACLYSGKVSLTKSSVFEEEATKRESGQSSQTVPEVLDETSSQGESEFEEAMSHPFTPPAPYNSWPKPSVTCMGDLTRVVAEKRSASTLTCANNITPSWIQKLSNEIRSKLKTSRANLRVYEKPYAKCGKELENVAGALKFTISADTPVGVLDVTVVQHKKRRNLKGRLMKLNLMKSQSAADPNNGSHSSGKHPSFTDDSEWSDDSLRNFDSESLDFGSVSDEDMEEFFEVFVEGSKKEDQGKRTAPIAEKGLLQELDLRLGKSHFFQIQKRHPVYFKQEIIRKKPEVKKKQRVEKLEEKVIAVSPVGKQEKQILLEGSSTDLVIYIQLELEDVTGQNPEDASEHKTITSETQTVEAKPLLERKIIRLEDRHPSGESLYKIWEDPKQNLKKMQKGTNVNEELAEKEEEGKRNVLLGKESKEVSVSFSGILSEADVEKEIKETVLEEPTVVETVRVVDVKTAKQRVDIWLPQNNVFMVQRLEIRNPIFLPKVSREIIETIKSSEMELKKAFSLIREIENNIVDVKFGDAISILPRLESELRKHLEIKMKELEGKEGSEYFFSASDIWPSEKFVSSGSESENSEDRLKNLLKMLSNLEEAIKLSECSSNESCDNSSKIYKLLQSLVVSIREVEVDLNYGSLSQTLEVASELDTAVREYEEMLKNFSLDYYLPEEEKKRRKRRKKNSKSLDVVLGKKHLQDIRKKVFEKAQESAIKVEQRIEKAFDRLDRLEVENDEALSFLEVFLKKSEQRVSELANLKSELQKLSESLKILFENFQELKKQQQLEAEKRARLEKLKQVSKSTLKMEPIKETVSDLLQALDSLKSVAKEKNEIRKEIFSEEGVKSEITSRPRSFQSFYKMGNSDQLNGALREFKRIGQTSLYLAWFKPEDVLQDSILGYHIYLNKKLNQKVRNPSRLQAVLYAVDFTQKNEIQLYAVVENNQKILLATANYDEEL